MSGHSKWSTIKRKKGANDAQRAAIFTKLGRELQVAVKAGGPDPDTNARLKEVISKAKSQNMPNENIQRSIKKAAGIGSETNYDEIIYEGYGAGGVAVMVKVLTDNKNRSAADIRHLFDKFGGNMGTSGCVSFMFKDKGQLVISAETFPDEETVMMDALDAGAEDFEVEAEIYVVSTLPTEFRAVYDALEQKGYTFMEAGVSPIPDTWIKVTEEEQVTHLEKMISLMEDHADVSDVYNNWESEE